MAVAATPGRPAFLTAATGDRRAADGGQAARPTTASASVDSMSGAAAAAA